MLISFDMFNCFCLQSNLKWLLSVVPSLFSRSPQCFKICLHDTKFAVFRVTTLASSDLGRDSAKERFGPSQVLCLHRTTQAQKNADIHIRPDWVSNSHSQSWGCRRQYTPWTAW